VTVTTITIDSTSWTPVTATRHCDYLWIRKLPVSVLMVTSLGGHQQTFLAGEEIPRERLPFAPRPGFDGHSSGAGGGRRYIAGDVAFYLQSTSGTQTLEQIEES
jgi:hypothetical protein